MNKRIFIAVVLGLVCLAGQLLLRPLCAEQSETLPVSPSQPDIGKPESPNSPRPAAPFMEKEGGPDDLRADLIRQLITMVVFIALAGGGVWGAAKHYRKKQLTAGGRQIRITESVPLGPRKALHLVEVNSRKLLIGSTGDRITFLSDLTDAPARQFRIPDLEEGSLE